LRTAHLICLILLCPSAAAQSPAPRAVKFGAEVRALGARLHLRDLEAGVPADEREVRVWSGFGVTGIQLHRAIRVKNAWTATESPNVGGTTPLPLEPAQLLSAWSDALLDSLAVLPPAPRRPLEASLVDDGWIVVIEVARGGKYFMLGTDHPDRFCTRDDQRLLRVVSSVVPNFPKTCSLRDP
jgi:hypothetical protein